MPHRAPNRPRAHRRCHAGRLVLRSLDLLHKLLTGGAALATLLRMFL